jgi:hypothetical protein
LLLRLLPLHLQAIEHMALATFASQETVPGCEYRTLAESCPDASYASYFVVFWRAILGVYIVLLAFSMPLVRNRYQSFKESSAKLPAGSSFRSRIACMQAADGVVLQLIAGIVLRLIQAVLLLHADSTLPRIVYEVLFELCIQSSVRFTHKFLVVLTQMLSKLKRRDGTQKSCFLLTQRQLVALDVSTTVVWVLLGCLDGLWSGVRGSALWWYLAAVTGVYYLLYKQVLKSLVQVTALTNTLLLAILQVIFMILFAFGIVATLH